MRAMVFANRAMASRGHLNEQARRWLDEAGTTPPGNGVERELWEARQALGQRPWLSSDVEPAHLAVRGQHHATRHCRRARASVRSAKFLLSPSGFSTPIHWLARRGAGRVMHTTHRLLASRACRARWQGPTMVAAMSAAERGEHEDRALKMRKAMGENLGDDVAGEEPSARERRLNLIRCA